MKQKKRFVKSPYAVDAEAGGVAEEGAEYAAYREQLAPLVTEIYRKLSPREREVLALLQQGAVEEQIAKTLNISRRAVRAFRGRMQEKVRKLVANGIGGKGLQGGLLLLEEGKFRF